MIFKLVETQVDSMTRILRLHQFSQPGVVKKAQTLLFYHARHVEVLLDQGKKVCIPPHLIELPVINSLDSLKHYLAHVWITLSQLSNNNYKLSAYAKGLGGGIVSSKAHFQGSSLTPEEIKLLKNYAKKNSLKTHEEGLQKACLERNITMVKLFLKTKVNPNIVVENETKTLKQWIAGDREERQISTLLIEAGADISKVEDIGRSSLVDAIEKNDEPLARALLRAGIKVNRKTTYDEPVLHMALNRKMKTTILELIHAGVDVNAPNSKGESPLANLIQARDDWQETDLREVLNALLQSNAKTNENDPSSINHIIMLIK